MKDLAQDVNLVGLHVKMTGNTIGQSLKSVLPRVRMGIIGEIIELKNKIKHNEINGFPIIKQIKSWNYKRLISKYHKWLSNCN